MSRRQGSNGSAVEVQVAAKRGTGESRHAKKALTQTRWGSKRANQSGLKKIELGASIHLAVDELELGNLLQVGRRAKSSTRWGSCASVSSHRDCGSKILMD